MRDLPLNTGPIHFLGIGGIGMSGIAEVMFGLGYKVQGSDAVENSNVMRLRKLGINITIGHHKKNIKGAEFLVVSSAVQKNNLEILEARKLNIPVVRRAEMLAELMRFKWSIAVGGTHGKTTTTSMISSVLDIAGLDPTVINGGIIKAYSTNARKGSGDWMVVEADESDGTFVKLHATATVVTNIDPEHLDFYKDFDSIKSAFKVFVENIPFYGFAAMCVDHPDVQSLCSQIEERKIIKYGLNPNADISAENIKVDSFGSVFDVILREPMYLPKKINQVKIKMPGKHNIQNALAAFLVGIELGIDFKTIVKGLELFSGVERRFSIIGSVNDITIIDDYAHHPVEIKAVLNAAKHVSKNKIIAVVQPHRFSRLQSLFNDFCTCFNEADVVVVLDVYPAGEEPIVGFDRDRLVEGIRSHGHKNVISLQHEKELPQTIAKISEPRDIVVCVGAGSISSWANVLPSKIKKILQYDLKEATL